MSISPILGGRLGIEKRRMMTDAMVQQIELKLRPGGTLHFWTD